MAPQFAQEIHETIKSGNLIGEKKLAVFQQQGFITHHFPFFTRVHLILRNQLGYIYSEENQDKTALSLAATCAYSENKSTLELLTKKFQICPNSRAIDQDLQPSTYLTAQLKETVKRGPSPLWLSVARNNYKLTQYIIDNSKSDIDWTEHHQIRFHPSCMNCNMMDLAVANNSPEILTLLIIKGFPIDLSLIDLIIQSNCTPSAIRAILVCVMLLDQAETRLSQLNHSLQMFNKDSLVLIKEILQVITAAETTNPHFYTAYNEAKNNRLTTIKKKYGQLCIAESSQPHLQHHV